MQPISCVNFRVAVFWSINPEDLDATVNEWLASETAKDFEVVDTTFQVVPIYNEKYEDKKTYVIHNMVLYLRKSNSA